MARAIDVRLCLLNYVAAPRFAPDCTRALSSKRDALLDPVSQQHVRRSCTREGAANERRYKGDEV